MKRFVLLLALISLPLVLHAQTTVKESTTPSHNYHPGQIIKFEIRFSGPDAHRMKTVSVSLVSNTGVPADQVGFTSAFQGAWVSPSQEGTFVGEIKIPENAATLDYTLFINAQAEDGAGIQYKGVQDFQMHTFSIENPKKLKPPQVTVKEMR